MLSVSKIANHAGVSKSTVSLVLNEKDGVSTRMRQRVMQAVEELQASTTSNKSSHSLYNLKNDDGVATRPSILALHSTILSSTQHFSEVLQGVQQGVQHFNANLSLAINEPELPDEHIASLYFSEPALHPDGVIVFGSDHYETIGQKTRELGIPCVFLGVPLPGRRLNFVAPDEAMASYNATKYLLDIGHRQIAFVCGDADIPATIQRLDGYKTALRQAGIDADSAPFFVEPRPTGAYLAMERFISSKSPVTALLMGNNHASRTGLPLLKQSGFTIPDHLSVIVFDDTEFQQTYDPPLTTVTYPLMRQGFWAVKVLFDLLNEPDLNGNRVYFDAKVTERMSCRPLGR